jgi:hypothetical protein
VSICLIRWYFDGAPPNLLHSIQQFTFLPLGMSDVVGQIHHECNVRPVFDDKYRSVVKERTAAAKEPKRKIVRLGKEDMIGGQGALNKLSSGAAPTAAFDNMVVSPTTVMSGVVKLILCRKYSKNPAKTSRDSLGYLVISFWI